VFDDVIDQEDAKRAIRSAISGGRLAHATLIHGPEGVGKKALARWMAMAINCADRADFPCGRCDNCRRIHNLEHPDLFVLFPAPKDADPDEERVIIRRIAENPYLPLEGGKNVWISIDKVRELERRGAFSSYGTARKIAIIFEADQMRPEAANALLKTLEEPPGGLALILVSSRPGTLFQTVLSRCQKLRLRRLSDKVLKEALVRRLGIPEERAALIAKLSDGSFSRAYMFAEEDLEELRGSAYDVLLTLLEGDETEVIRAIERLSRDRISAERFFGMGAVWLRDVLAYSHGYVDGVVNFDSVDRIGKLSAHFKNGGIEKVLRSIDSSMDMMSRNVNLKLIIISFAETLRGMR